MERLYAEPAWRITSLLVSGDVSVEDYVGSIYERIEKLEDKINAYITLRPRELVEAEARKAVEKARRGEKLPLAGVLVAVKDNIHVEGLPVTCGSRMLEKYVAPYDATVVSRLRAAGAVIIGKTNMDEFAMGSTGENSAYGATRNPWSLDRVPGGSSSGTAAALAAGMATLGLGSDTGGSIRMPCAWTGLYGVKPTYGLVSRYGLVAYADSLEQIGPMARNVRDLALLLETIAGFDPRDSTSLPVEKVELLGAVEKGYGEGLRGLRVGVVEEFLEHEGVDESVKKLVERAAELLGEAEAVVEPVRLGREVLEYSLPAYYVVAMAEASSNLARYDGVRYGPKEPPEPWESWNQYYSRIRGKYFGREVKLRIMLGAWMLSSGYKDQYYVRALKLRALVRRRLLQLLQAHDLLLAPAVVTPPPRLGEVVEDPAKMYALDLATVTANLAGIPAGTAPVGYVDGVPLGVQLMARPLAEQTLIQGLAALERLSGLHNLVAEPAT
ncbi:Asp-tRNA(Asn)/Glu-tRNA(Gln) amidotransferase subunit GatA [Hyperthermus butylicus]|uniref:Asp-tRNA(Asn)/Glu-tRNA(Gln) amidotransferase subunit GatA n=1 Tax=Hyperthermus butylicus TaxID=54248 RepID=UPI000322D9C1|nr:Asp-tRNA(Asn)/Glu-tRNA(Gln) amidotransferase subunit GatA [Hyperthermus butylicus]